MRFSEAICCSLVEVTRRPFATLTRSENFDRQWPDIVLRCTLGSDLCCWLLSFEPYYGYIATAGAVLIFCFAIANEFLTRTHLKAASTNAVVASSYAAATFRNAEVLHAMDECSRASAIAG